MTINSYGRKFYVYFKHHINDNNSSKLDKPKRKKNREKTECFIKDAETNQILFQSESKLNKDDTYHRELGRQITFIRCLMLLQQHNIELIDELNSIEMTDDEKSKDYLSRAYNVYQFILEYFYLNSKNPKLPIVPESESKFLNIILLQYLFGAEDYFKHVEINTNGTN